MKLIKNEIIIKYEQIYNNISTPFKNYSKSIMICLSLKKMNYLKKFYKVNEYKEKISDVINKKSILKGIEIVKKEKSKSIKMAKEIFINNILYTEVIIDTVCELIENERFYNKKGKPLFWSNANRLLCFKYEKNNPFKLVNFITNSLLKLLIQKINDKNQINIIKEELKNNEQFDNNYELEETLVKLEVSKLILDQILNETIEILSHVESNRKNPKLYQFKSIYSCEELPILELKKQDKESFN